MNKHCYRIIFNRARQLLMVVADIAKSRVKTPSSSRRSGRSAPNTSLSVTLKPLIWSLALAVGAVSFHTAAAVVADGSAPGNQQPTIIAGANGTPQVNIQSPNSSGVSHNKYQNFDVDNKGVILNNSAVNTQTQLGGLITGNPWLAKGEASVILNEVNSANPSQLNGFVEVAGKRADVIIANPAGITCSGCGFINANKTTLAAAQVLLEQGKIAGFDVKNGQIAIQGNGLNDTQSDYTQLIARAVKINAKLHAKDLSMTTGKNRTDANGKVLSTDLVADEAPEFAIDVASLGGMYANKIRLVGTEKGVGVRNAGHLGADVGGFTLTTEGKLQNTGILESKGDSTLNVAQAVSQQGQWLTEGNASLITQANMQQSGTISAGKNLNIQAKHLTQSDNGHLLAGVNVAGQKQTAGDLTLKTTEALQLQGKLSASGQLSATGTDIHAQNAQIESQRLSLNALTGDLDLTDAQVNTAQRAALQAKQQISTSGATVSVGDLTADSASWDNTNGTVVAQNTLALRMSQLNNTQGTLGAGQSVTLNSQTLDNTQGTITSQGNLTIAGHSTARTQQVNNAQGALNAGTEMSLQAEQLIGKGDIVSTGNATLTLGQAWDNQQHVQTGGNLTVNAEKGLTNHAKLLAGKTLTLTTSTLNNTKDGEIQGETTTLNVDTLNNTGVIDGGTTSITSQTLNNQDSGRIYGDTVIINSRVLNNIKTADSTLAPLIAGRDALYLGVQKLQNQDHALLLSGGDLQIGGNATAAGVTGRSDEINNHSATLEANGEIVIDTTVLDNRDIHLSLSDTPIEVDRESFHEHEWCDGDGDGGCYGGDGTRYVMQPKYGNVTSYAINPDGSINYNVSLIGGDKNRYRFCVGGNCQKHFYEYYYDRVTYETQIIHQDPAVIRSGKGMTLRGETLTNQDGHLLAGGALTIDATHFNNLETQGERWVREVDTPGHEGRGTISHYKGGSDWETKQSYYTYQGVNTAEALSLGTLKKVENTQEASTVTLDPGKKNPALDEIIVKYPPVLDITLPDNSLYQLHPGSDSEYLIETDARFTNRKKWLSSLDYLDSDSLFKRLGDGYYEQSLIRDQLIAATGNQYLGNYTDSNAQYEALLTAGIAYGEKYQLTPGIALSAEQMANLTTDMVWMVNQAVTLPDGSIEMVSVPKVYLAASNANTLTAQGGLVSGKSVTITTTDDTQNQGTIFGERVEIDAKNIDNRGTIKGDSLTLNAQNDIINTGGTLHAKQSLDATAGRDLILKTEQHQDGKEGWLDRPATVYVENEDGTLNLSGFRDVNLIAAQVISQGKETTITAGRDLNLETQKVSHATDYTRDSERYDRRESTQDIGSAISTQGNLTLNAGNDVNIKGSEVRSDATLNVDAGNNLNITAGESTFDQDARSKWTDKKLLSKTTHTLHGEVHEKTAQSSTLSGNQVNLNAGKDITVSASNVMAENDLTATAGNNLNITTADELREDDVERTKKTSGITSSGGLGFTVGKQSVKQTTDTDSNQKKGSVIGSTAGNVTLTAGNTATIHGSDVIAAKDINVTASDINITAAENTRTDVTTTETKSSGLSISLGGSVGSALNTAYQTGKAAQETDDSQLKALQGIKAGLKLEQANQAGQLAAAQNPGSDMTNNGSFGVDVSYGSSSSKSTSKTEQKTASGSSLTAGDNLTLNATGKAADSQGNIHVQGSTLNADKDLTLNAKNDITLSSATNTQTVDSKNESKGTTVGVGISAGTGWNVNASVNKGSGFEKGNSQYYTDTEVNAGKTLTINSGKDTTLTGAQASGDTVKMNVGGDLTLSSQQVTDKYESKQTNSSVGGSYSQSGAVSVNVSADKSEMHSDYQSVDNQTGIHAGQGGFDITVGDHTQLDGAVISSDASKDKNRLDTGTIGFNDIENKADYTVEQQSGGYNTGGDIGGKLISNAGSALLAGVNNKGKDSNTTQSAVAEGDIIVRDTDKQTQNVDDLSRDTDNAHEKLGTIFDKDEEQKRIDRNQLIGEIGQQIKDIAVTDARINATQNVLKNNPELKGDDLEAAIQAEINQSKWGVGGENTRIVDAGTALIQGLANGDVNAAVANASAPYIANYIAKEIGKDNKAGLLAAHAIANVALALAKDENALSQAAGAVTAEAMGMLSQELYKKDVSQLTEEEKSTLSAFASLAAGIAGGLVGGETQDALNAAQAGKNTVENNSLSGDQLRESYKDSAKWWKDQTRETFGEGTTSIAINSVIGALEDAGDLAIAGGDYVLDGAAAVTACATASNYCQKALNDLEGKHQGALDVATSLINGDSWNAIQDLAKRAGEGDQLAAEQLGAAMAGIFIPGKKVPTPATGGKIPGKLPEGSNWTAGEGAFSPNNGKGTITDVVKDDAKYDGNSLPYGKDGLDKGTTGQINNGLEWNSWQNYPKATVDGKQYAQVGDRLYSQHAVDRMQPSGLGSPAGTVGAGRNISPGIVEYAINNGSKTTTSVNGVERVVYWSGEVGVVTENNAKVIVTILRRSEK